MAAKKLSKRNQTKNNKMFKLAGVNYFSFVKRTYVNQFVYRFIQHFSEQLGENIQILY